MSICLSKIICVSVERFISGFLGHSLRCSSPAKGLFLAKDDIEKSVLFVKPKVFERTLYFLKFRFLVGAFLVQKKPTLVVTLFFFFFRSTNCFTSFPWQIILKRASTVYNKHGKALTNTKRSLLRIFSNLETKTLHGLLSFCTGQMSSANFELSLACFLWFSGKFGKPVFLRVPKSM